MGFHRNRIWTRFDTAGDGAEGGSFSVLSVVSSLLLRGGNFKRDYRAASFVGPELLKLQGSYQFCLRK